MFPTGRSTSPLQVRTWLLSCNVHRDHTCGGGTLQRGGLLPDTPPLRSSVAQSLGLPQCDIEAHETALSTITRNMCLYLCYVTYNRQEGHV